MSTSSSKAKSSSAAEVEPQAEPKAQAREATGTLGAPPLTIVNPGTVSMVYDLVGHSLGGGERVDVSAVDRVGQQAVRNGYLLCRDSNGNYVTWDRKGVISERPVTGAQPVLVPSAKSGSSNAETGGASDRD